MSGERSEKASEQRKKKARDKGDSVRSRELTGAMALLGGLMLLGMAARQFTAAWRGAFQGSVEASLRNFTSPEQMVDVCGRLLLPLLAPLLLVMAAALAGALSGGLLQGGGLHLSASALAWKPSRLNPLSNLKQIFSARAVLRLAKPLLPASAVALIGIHLLRQSLLTLPPMSGARMGTVLESGYRLALDAAWIGLGWSALDYAVEWRSWTARLKMTKQEVREEAKESNGNPHTKGRMRRIQQLMRKRRVKADVSRATVVITNPTHYAVALLFSFETMSAPTVLAKGRDLHAAEIREQARWAGVPLVENPPLARSLFRSVEEGQPIPYELYAAVAAILAFLHRQERERERQRAQYGIEGYRAAPGAASATDRHEKTIEGER